MSAFSDVETAMNAGNVRLAYDALNGHVMRGSPQACFELAIWLLEGRLVRRDLARARSLFLEAANRGNPDAFPVASALLAVGLGGERDWPSSLAWLRRAAERDAALARELDLVAEMTLTDAGEPARVLATEEQVADPEVRWARQFLTAAECQLLIDRARPYLTPSVIIDPVTRAARPDPIRTSENATFPWVNETPFIHAINRRIAAAAGASVECGEPLQVLHYCPGQEYRRHSDALPGEPNQRVMTALIYLNTDFDGGETEFPELGLSLRGNPGDLLIFRNIDFTGNAHPLAHHVGKPVRRGEKWLASRWIRMNPFVG